MVENISGDNQIGLVVERDLTAVVKLHESASSKGQASLPVGLSGNLDECLKEVGQNATHKISADTSDSGDGRKGDASHVLFTFLLQ